MTAQDTGNRRPDLIRAAAKLFREKGFDGTTTRDIAAAVGMRSGSPFYHFKSKQEILLAVIEEGLAGGLAKAEAAIGAGLAPREKFCALVKGHLETIHDAGSDFIPVMIYDWRRLGPEGQAKMIALEDRYDVIWQQMLQELKRAGLLRDDWNSGAPVDVGRHQFLGLLVPRRRRVGRSTRWRIARLSFSCGPKRRCSARSGHSAQDKIRTTRLEVVA